MCAIEIVEVVEEMLQLHTTTNEKRRSKLSWEFRRHVGRHDRCRHIWDDRQNVTTQSIIVGGINVGSCNTVPLLTNIKTRFTNMTTALIAALCSQHRFNLDKPQQPSIAQDLLCRRVCRVWRPHYYKAVKTAL